MRYLSPGLLNVDVKGMRGLAGRREDFEIQPVVINLVATMEDFGGVELVPGEETTLEVPLPGLLPNANIKGLKTVLEVWDEESQAVSDKSSLKQTSVIEEVGGEKKTYNVDLKIPALPRNISLRLDGGEVFWSFSGTLLKGTYNLPAFVEQINSYLDKLPEDSKEVSLKFLVKSDAPGRVKVLIKNVEYSLIKTKSWPNSLDDTTRSDRNLQLDFGMIKRIELDPSPEQGRQVFLSKIDLDIGGEFSRERYFKNIEEHNGKEFATVSSDYSLAQSFKSDIPLLVVGITGLFRADSKAELYIELQNDSGGFPAAEPPLAKSNLILAPDQDKEEKQWAYTSFEAQVNLKPEKQYWIVIKGIQGKALIALQSKSDQYSQVVLYNRGGQLWKGFVGRSEKPLSALLRLVFLPDIDNQVAAVEIGIEGAEDFQRLDPRPEAQTISFDIPQGKDLKQPVIVVKSQARGTLSIANVIQEYTPVGKNALFKLLNRTI
jgi:hypothetical protein